MNTDVVSPWRNDLQGIRFRQAFIAMSLLLILASMVWVAVAAQLSDGHWVPRLTALWFVFGLGAVPICCLRRSWNRGGQLDFFQPGTVFALYFLVYVLVPAYNVWQNLDYQSSWVDPSWPRYHLFNSAFALSLLGLVAFGFGYHTRSRDSGRRFYTPGLARLARSLSSISTAAILTMLFVGLAFKLRHLSAIGGVSSNALLFLSPTFSSE